MKQVSGRIAIIGFGEAGRTISAGWPVARDTLAAFTTLREDDRVTTIDVEATAAKLNEFQQITISGVRQRDWAGRSIDEMTPMVFPGGA
mgnify:CR=1 FL=1